MLAWTDVNFKETGPLVVEVDSSYVEARSR